MNSLPRLFWSFLVIFYMSLVMLTGVTNALLEEGTKSPDISLDSALNPFRLESRDVGGPFLGIAKGITNGDFVRSLLELAGMRNPPGLRGNQTLTPDIPWPNVLTEAINQFDQNLSRVVFQLQAVVRSLESNRVIG